MKPCSHCQRHIFEDTRACPFCQHRAQFVGARVVLGVALGLGSVSCAAKDGGDTGATMTSPDDDEDGSGPSTETWSTDTETGNTTTTGPTPDTTDEGGSYYAGPGSTTWEESSGGTTTTGAESSDSTDAGGSYYAGPTSTSGVWDEDPERPA
jgi:hypothetical protein